MTARDAWETQSLNEEDFERQVRRYVLDNAHRYYRFGGIVNLMTTLATICEQEEQNQRCADYGVAAAEFRRMGTVLDLKYEPRERDE